ncbi:MAG: Re/Si-specific NAD(P)(+) transhydrogenase subunit alpha [Saprospiraceae bacterium]
MNIGIPKEWNDPRVALTPPTVKKIKDLGVNILVEKGAGVASSFGDDLFAEDAQLVERKDVLAADVIISINPLPVADLKNLAPGTLLISQFKPFFDDSIITQLKNMQLKAFSLDMIPRTTLAQSMDVLSSMASIAGYKAVLMAANHLPRYFPMMITAAGSIKPAKVLVLGAGVAGLQAIATAKRLGAQVEASDTRLAAKEEVESLGAKFVMVEGAADDSGAGGYAVQQSEDFLKRQREEVQNRASKADVVITTAQVRGRKAPILLPKETLDKMQPGSVVVDLAASTGGNCEMTKDREVTKYNGITIIGDSDLAATMPQDASTLFANNLVNFLKLIIKDGELTMNMEDEIVKGSYITGE